MSSLIVSHDLHLLMLEFSVDKLFVPRTSEFDKVMLKRTTVLFRVFDENWITLRPHRRDYYPYKGSNREEEFFYGGKSVVFALPETRLEKPMDRVVVDVLVIKEVSKYFEIDPCQTVGTLQLHVEDLFNYINQELKERKDLEMYLSCIHKRKPISSSLRGSYNLLNETQEKSGATIELYVRISYLGQSVITEIQGLDTPTPTFYVQEETNERYPYQCRELNGEEVLGGCWGSRLLVPPVNPLDFGCACDKENFDKGQGDIKETAASGKGGRGGKNGRNGKGGTNANGKKGPAGKGVMGKEKGDKGAKGKKGLKGGGGEAGKGSRRGDDVEGGGAGGTGGSDRGGAAGAATSGAAGRTEDAVAASGGGTKGAAFGNGNQ
ncbi:uncharacterized protein LOC105700091 [Orussus abietinus]|uniref:uncharacterized protein LOC105700091 n=1 Tax=Orussus abietinus TaxID=222816 RepID=UPI00062540BD|nr:uncharacterized protein LOC105700091 [Orussus abietinus]